MADIRAIRSLSYTVGAFNPLIISLLSAVYGTSDEHVSFVVQITEEDVEMECRFELVEITLTAGQAFVACRAADSQIVEIGSLAEFSVSDKCTTVHFPPTPAEPRIGVRDHLAAAASELYARIPSRKRREGRRAYARRLALHSLGKGRNNVRDLWS